MEDKGRAFPSRNDDILPRFQGNYICAELKPDEAAIDLCAKMAVQIPYTDIPPIAQDREMSAG